MTAALKSWYVNSIKYGYNDMGVSINGGSPKWRGFVRENPIRKDDWGVFQETSIYPL